MKVVVKVPGSGALGARAQGWAHLECSLAETVVEAVEDGGDLGTAAFSVGQSREAFPGAHGLGTGKQRARKHSGLGTCST